MLIFSLNYIFFTGVFSEFASEQSLVAISSHFLMLRWRLDALEDTLVLIAIGI